jgi:hypothetical protein
MTRYLARADAPQGVAEELAWINSRTRLLGESFSTAVREIDRALAAGEMIVVAATAVPQEDPTP